MRLGLWKKLVSLGEREALQPDLGRACRCTLAFMLPLLAFSAWWPGEAAFAAIASHSLALLDVRGPYPLRLGFLLAMLLVLLGATALGSAAGGSAAAAVLATGLVALNAGLWRHLSPEYGVALSGPPGLVFLMALSAPAHGGHALAVLLGGLCALALQVALWPVRAQHPLRRAVAESWLAVADLLAALAAPGPGPAGHQVIAAQESQLRA